MGLMDFRKGFYARMDKLVTISIRDKAPSKDYIFFDREFVIHTYENWIQRLFFSPKVTLERHSGWYSGYVESYVDQDFGLWQVMKDFVKSEQEVLNTRSYYMIEDHKLYYKPYIKITYMDGSTFEKYFDTFEMAQEFVERLSLRYKLEKFL